MIRWLPAALLAVVISGCGGGGGDGSSTNDPVQTLPPPVGSAVSGMASKGPLDTADLEFIPIDATGATIGTALATAITNADGSFNVNIPPGTGALLVRSSGGSYVDEADREPDPQARRRITLNVGEGLESLLPPGATSSTISIATQSLVYKTRRETQGDMFLQQFAANRALAESAYGFDIIATVPADPVTPDPGLTMAQRQYAMVLGGLANVVRRVSIDLGLPEPNIDSILAVARDFSDGRIDGMEDGDAILVNGVEINAYSLNDEITRFRNNNFDSYAGTPLISIDETVLSQPGIPINTIPVAQNDSYSLDVGDTLTITAPGILLNDADADGDALSAVLVTAPVNSSAFNLSADGSFSYTHNGSSIAPDSFSYLASDGVNDSNLATVTLLFSNTAPIANDDTVTVLEGNTVSAASVLDNDTDANGDTLTAVLVSGPANASDFFLDNGGTFVYTHNGSETTGDQFSYRASDGIDSSNPAVVTIQVTPVNDAPITQDDNLVVDQGATQILLANGMASVLDNDSDAEGDTLMAVLVNPPVAGQLTLNPDGTFIYVHDGTASATDQFSYSATDGVATSFAATVFITINVVTNSPPIVNDDEITVDEGDVAVLLSSGADSVLDNDVDADQDNLTAILTDAPNNGVLTLNPDGTFEYVHDGSETSVDSFSYIANDGIDDSSGFASVQILINAVNDPPINDDDSMTVLRGETNTELDSGESSVLSNDFDAENDPLTAILLDPPTNGQLSLNPDGTFAYSHDGSPTLSDSFVYIANDGVDDADSPAFVDIVIISTGNNAPIGQDDFITVAEGGTQTLLDSGDASVLDNDIDPDGDTLTALLATAPQNGLLTLNGDGTFVYMHDGSPTSSDFFTYIPTDADVEVATVITSASGADAAFFAVGQPVVVRYDLDPSVVDSNPDPDTAVYPGATERLLLDFPGLGTTLDFADGNVQVFNDLPSFGDQAFIIANQGVGTLDGVDVNSIEVDLIGPTSMLPNDGLPQVLPDVIDEFFAVINTDNGTTFVNFSVQEISLTVPQSMSSSAVLVDILIAAANSPPRLTTEAATVFQVSRVLEGVARDEHTTEVDTLFLLNGNGTLSGASGEVPTFTSGAEFAPGIFGPGIELAQTDQLTYAAQNNIQSDTGTVEFWIQPDWNGNDGQDHFVLSWGSVGGILIGKDAANNLRIIVNRFVFTGQETERSAGSNISTWLAGQWHHCAFTWDANELRVFIDGIQVASSSVGYNLPAISASDFHVGSDNNASILNGVIDELRISNTVRSNLDIAQAFAGGRLPLALVAGTITTDGNVGMPGIIDWDLNLLRIAEGGNVSLQGPLSGNNSVFFSQQASFISTDSQLLYPLDGQAGEIGFCLNACGIDGPEWVIGGAGVGGHTERISNVGGGSTETLRDFPQTLFIGFGEADSGIDSVSVDFGVSDAQVDLFPVFEDDEDADTALQFSVSNNTNSALVVTNINNGTLDLAFGSEIGPARLTVRATDTDGEFVETAFHVCVRDPNSTLLSSYDFTSGLEDTLGNGNDLTSLGGNVDSGRYFFGQNEGLRLSSALPCPTDYAVEVKLQINDELDEFNKLIDFQDLQSDDGLYTLSDGITFFPFPDTSNSLTLNTDFTVGIERINNQVEVFLNGVPIVSVIDNKERAAPIENILNFFVDDVLTAQTESFIGSADFIRIHNNSSTFGTQPNGNSPPTDILIDNSSVAEGQPVGTVVGTFTTLDPDCCDAHIYTLVTGPGGDDNDLFNIVNNAGVFRLNTNAIFDAALTPTLSVRVQTDDQDNQGDGTFQKVFTITVTNSNSAPTDIILDNAQIDEGGFTNMVIGVFTTTDPDTGDDHSYDLVAGPGDDDNGDFNIDNNELQNSIVFDVSQTETRSIRVQSSDGNGGVFEKQFTITINNISNPRNWISIVDGDWGDPANWSPFGVPQPGDDVVIDVGNDNPVISMNQDQPDINSINSVEALVMDFNSRIIVHAASSLSANTQFEEGALLEANGPDASLTINGPIEIGGADLQVFNGGVITINNTSMVTTASQVWLADTGGTLNFPVLTAIQLGTPTEDNGPILLVEAFAGGTVDMPMLNSILIDDGTSASQRSARLFAECDGLGASIRMPQLSNLIDNDDDGGSGVNGSFRLSRFEAFDDCSIEIPLLTAPEQTGIVFSGSGSINVTQLVSLVDGGLDLGAGNYLFPNLADLSGSSIILRANATASLSAVTGFDHASAEVLGGSVLSLPGVNSYLLNNLQTTNGAVISSIFRASGAGSRLEFPGLVTMQAGLPADDTGPRISIEALLGGLVDFPTMTSANVDDGDSVNERRSDIDILADGVGSRVQLPQLMSFSDNDYAGNEDGLSSLTTSIDATIQIPSLASTNQVAISISESASMDIAQLQSVSNGSLAVENGSYDFPALTDLTGSIVRAGSADAGASVTSITLPNVTTIDHGGVEAYDGSVVSLPGVTSYLLENPISGFTNIFSHEVLWRADGTNSRIEFPSLINVQVGDANADTGPNLDIEGINGGVVSLPVLIDFLVMDADSASARGSEIDILSAGDMGQVDIPQLQSFTDLDLRTPSTITETTNGIVNFPGSAMLSNVIVNGNQFPTALFLDTQTVQEGQPAGTLVGTFSTQDPDAGDTHTYMLVPGEGSADNNLFQISGDQLLTAVVLSNGEDPMPTIRVQSQDQDGGIFEETFIISVVVANNAPTAILLDNDQVQENQPTGTLVGNLSTTDPDAGDTHIYSLVAGAGDTDNASFQIVGNALQTAVILDSAVASTLTVRVQTDDQNGGTFADLFIITVNPTNAAPTAININNDSVSENLPPGTPIGTLSTIDPDQFDVHSYSLVAGAGDAENPLVQIVNDQLQTATVLDATLTPTLNVRIQTDDGNGGTFQQAFVITVIDVRTITWVSQASGLWSEPTNWSPAGPPLDNDAVVINVPGVVVTLDVDAFVNSVNSDQQITMAPTSSLLVAAPSSITEIEFNDNVYLGVAGPSASLDVGNIDVLGDTFFEAFVEGLLSIGNIAINTESENHIWSVSDAGRIEFPNLLSIEAGAPDGNTGVDFIIDAFGSGSIDFPALQSITVTDSGGGLIREFAITAIDPGTEINMPLLALFADLDDTFTGSVGNSSLTALGGGNILVPQMAVTEQVEFTIDGNSFINTAQLTDVTNGSLNLNGGFFSFPNLSNLSGSQVNAGLIQMTTVNFSAVTNFNNAGASVSNGTVLTLPGVTSYQFTESVFIDEVFWTADWGAQLNFPNLASIIVAGSENGPILTSVATSAGQIDLPVLQSVQILDDGGFRESYARFEAFDSDSLISMPQLSIFNDDDASRGADGLSILYPRMDSVISIGSLASTRGVGIQIDADIGLDIEQLESIHDGLLQVNSGAAVFSSLTDLSGSQVKLGANGIANVDLSLVSEFDNAAVEVHNGTVLSLPAVLDYTLSANVYLDAARWLAQGSGSRLEFPNLSSGVVLSLNNTENWAIDAIDGGVIDLPVLTSLNVTDGAGFRAADIDVYAASGGIVQMPMLNVFNDADPDLLSGLSSLEADGGTIQIPSLTTIDQVRLSLDDTSSIDIAQFTSITNGEIVLDGQDFVFPNLTDISGNIVRIGTIFLPTTVDFSNVTSADNTAYEVLADNQLSLPSVSSIVLDSQVTTNIGEWFVQEIGSSLTFPALTSLQVGLPGTDGQRIWSMFASEGGVINFPLLSSITVTDGGNFANRKLEMFASGFNSAVQMPMLTHFDDLDVDSNEAGTSMLAASDMGFINSPLMTSTTGVSIQFDELSAVSVLQLISMRDGVLELIGFGGLTVNMQNTTDMSGSKIILTGGAEVDLSSMSMFDGGSIEVYDGATLSLPGLSSYLLENNNFGDSALWRAEGVGSTIILPNLLTGQVGLNGTGGTKNWSIEAVNTGGGGIDFLAITDLLVEDSGNFTLRGIDILADGGPAIVDLQPMDNFIDNDLDSPSTVTTAGGGGIVNISGLANLQNVVIN